MSECKRDFEYIECVNHLNCGDYAMEGSDYCETCCRELQYYEIKALKEQRHQLLAKLGTIGALMKEQRYDEALALLPPNCDEVVREIQAEAVDKYNKAFTGICKEMGYPQIANAAETFAKAYINQLRNPEQEKV